MHEHNQKSLRSFNQILKVQFLINRHEEEYKGGPVEYAKIDLFNTLRLAVTLK